MAINFIGGRFVQHVGLFGLGSMNILALHYPDADAFVATRIHITGIFDGHLGVGGVQAAGMFVVQPLFAADKYFPQRPFLTVRRSGSWGG